MKREYSPLNSRDDLKRRRTGEDNYTSRYSRNHTSLQYTPPSRSPSPKFVVRNRSPEQQYYSNYTSSSPQYQHESRFTQNYNRGNGTNSPFYNKTSVAENSSAYGSSPVRFRNSPSPSPPRKQRQSYPNGEQSHGYGDRLNYTTSKDNGYGAKYRYNTRHEELPQTNQSYDNYRNYSQKQDCEQYPNKNRLENSDDIRYSLRARRESGDGRSEESYRHSRREREDKDSQRPTAQDRADTASDDADRNFLRDRILPNVRETEGEEHYRSAVNDRMQPKNCDRTGSKDKHYSNTSSQKRKSRSRSRQKSRSRPRRRSRSKSRRRRSSSRLRRKSRSKSTRRGRSRSTRRASSKSTRRARSRSTRRSRTRDYRSKSSVDRRKKALERGKSRARSKSRSIQRSLSKGRSRYTSGESTSSRARFTSGDSCRSKSTDPSGGSRRGATKTNYKSKSVGRVSGSHTEQSSGSKKEKERSTSPLKLNRWDYFIEIFSLLLLLYKYALTYIRLYRHVIYIFLET